ncbi:hypothetical protein D3C71_1089580 [compost metagenome]
MVRFDQFQIAGFQRGGQRFAGTVDNTAQAFLLSCIYQMGEFFAFNARRKAAADDQNGTAFDCEYFLFQLAKLIVFQHGAWHDETVLFAARFDVDVQILSCPVFGFHRIDGHVFIGQQRHQMFTGRTARRENSRGCPAEMSDGSCDVNPAAAWLKDRGATAEFTFRINLWGEGRAVERRGERQRINRYHYDLLFIWTQLSMAQIAGRESK